MARTVLEVRRAEAVNRAARSWTYAATLAAPDATEGAEFRMGKDAATLLLLVNDGGTAVTATICASDGMMGASDLKIPLAAGQATVVRLDSGRYQQMQGADAGKVLLRGGAKAAVFEGA